MKLSSPSPEELKNIRESLKETDPTKFSPLEGTINLTERDPD